MKRVILWMVVVSMSAVAVHAQMAQTPAEKTQAQKEPTPAKEEMPAGWVMRTDQPLEKAPPRFWTMPPGWHITSGPAAIYYDPAQIARGEFRLESQQFLFPPGERFEGYGFFFAGRDLDGPNQTYTYFLLRRDGKFTIKQRAGEQVKEVVPWTEHAAIAKHDGSDNAVKNEPAIEARAADVDFIVNGQRVHSIPRAQLNPEGAVGLRVNHRVNIHITYLAIKPRGAAARKLEKEIVVAGSLADVWNAWTTRDGVTSFFAPDANLELKPGGKYEMLFDTTQREGRKGGEGCTVVAVEPMKKLVVTWNAPPTLPQVRRQFSRVTLTFHEEGKNVRVKLLQDDWGSGPEWDEAYTYFDRAWGVVLGNLQYRFAKGPVEWKEGKFTVAGAPAN